MRGSEGGNIVYLWLIHVHVWQKHCKANIIRLKLNAFCFNKVEQVQRKKVEKGSNNQEKNEVENRLSRKMGWNRNLDLCRKKSIEMDKHLPELTKKHKRRYKQSISRLKQDMYQILHSLRKNTIDIFTPKIHTSFWKLQTAQNSVKMKVVPCIVL